MKTKNKIIALMEIAIVLCSVFLVAIPGIAAEQTAQEMSVNGVTTASEDDYVLGVYGNANEDDTIDMGDVVYIKLAIFGKKPKTELCDAKYDGRINVLDVIQTKLIILGKEKELTVVDICGEEVTVHKPIKRILETGYSVPEVLRTLDAVDKVVGICDYIKSEPVFFPELSKLPSVGRMHYPDYEVVLSLNPDVFIGFETWRVHVWPGDREKLSGSTITVCSLDLRTPEYITENVTRLGYVLDKEKEAEKFSEWYGGYVDMIKDRTKELSDDKKTKVYIEMASGNYKIGYLKYSKMCVSAGGKDIADNLPVGIPLGHKVDPEWVVEQNPDIIIKTTATSCGYSVDDPSSMNALRDSILGRPELAEVSAVKNSRVHIVDYRTLMQGPSHIVFLAYMAKWFYPELFEDLDPEVIHQEYLDRFQHIDFDVYEHGVFVYPPLE